MLVYWVRDYDVDGFRMDAADRVPTEFWQWLRPQLNAVKPILLLAEDESPRDYPAFDMNYNWSFLPVLWALAKQGVDDAANTQTATALDALRLRMAHDFPPGAVLMNHLDNHDLHQEGNPWVWGYGPVKNRIAGNTVLARYGPGYRAFSVLTATLPGRPMVYNGQELYVPGDPTPPPVPTTPEKLRHAPNFDFYRRLLTTYQQHPALYEGAFLKVPTGHDEAAYAFVRSLGSDLFLVILNLSGMPQTVTLQSSELPGRYREIFTDREERFADTAKMSLEPWSYRVYVRQ